MHSAVLIADDDLEICQALEYELGRGGIPCQITTDPLAASQRLGQGDVRVLVAGTSLAGVDATDLLVQIRDKGLSCKVIVLSGLASRRCLGHAMLLGAYDSVDKPVAPGQVLAMVQKAMADRSPTLSLPAAKFQAIQTHCQARYAALESVRALVQAVEAKDPYTRRHSETVAFYAAELAKAMNLPATTVESIRVAALLHDIGKIGVPDQILVKPGPLTSAEFDHVRRHPGLGGDILANITLFRDEARLVRHHHEWWNGRGYPDKLCAEETPLGSRIIHLADSMDAMLMYRTYKQGYPVDKMLRELTRGVETQFDPTLAVVALSWCQANPDKLVLPAKEAAAVTPQRLTPPVAWRVGENAPATN
jgi:putative two-component system response regulator